MDLFLINTAQILYLCSYLMRDILWLRVLMVVGIIFMVPYYYMRSEPLIAAILWDLVFLSINV